MMYVCMYVCMCVCVCIYVYMYEFVFIANEKQRFPRNKAKTDIYLWILQFLQP